MRRGGSSAREAGQAAVEYLGVIIASGVLVLAIAAGSGQVREALGEGLQRVVCEFQSGEDCGSGGDAPALDVLDGEVAPGADLPEPGERDQVGLGAGVAPGGSTRFATDVGESDPQSCFAQAEGCGPSLDGAIITPEQADELDDPVEPGPDTICEIEVNNGEPIADQAACEQELSRLLEESGIGEENFDAAREAIFGALADQGCAGFAGLGAGGECDAGDRLHVAGHVLDYLAESDSAEDLADRAERISLGDTIPELEPPPPPPTDCEAATGVLGALSDISGATDLCKSVEALRQGDVLGAAVNLAFAWPGAGKVGKVGREVVEEGAERLGKEATEEGAEQAGREATEEGVEGAAAKRIRENREAGQAAEQRIAAQYPGAQTQVYRQTPSGGKRYIDVLTPDGRAIESKVGRTSNSRSIRAQYEKDAELLKTPGNGVTSIEWRFSVSPTTGKGGPSPALERELRSRGIGVVRVPGP